MKQFFLPILLLSACATSQNELTITADVIAEGFLFTEGPVWSADGGLLFSDIPADRVYRWTEEAGVDTFLTGSGNSNGLAYRSDGWLVLAQHAGRVSVLDTAGVLQTLASQWEGKRLNSPNDLAYHPSGHLFFTDPHFGVEPAARELTISGVYRLSPSGELSLVYDAFELPNGIAFSTDFTKMYVADSETGDIFVWTVDADGNATDPKPFANIGPMTAKGGADGLKTDDKGRLFTTGPNGLIVFDSDGAELKRMEFAEQVTNLAWGAEGWSTLYMTATDKVYKLSVR
jgi:gluconolactonase